MKCTIHIDMWNAAFADNPDSELATILHNLAERIEFWGDPPPLIELRDGNGNRVGEFRIERQPGE